MNSADSHLLASRRMIPAGIMLVLLFGGVALLLRPHPGDSEGHQASPAATAAAPFKSKQHGGGASLPVAATPASLPSGGSPDTVATVLPGHEGHGDECAQCLAERKLAVYREDFAQLHCTQASEGRAPTPEQANELLDACRRFSKSALREWSFSDSKPRLADDSTLETLRSEMLQPLIDRLLPAVDDAP